eukprot:TRINITY_DN5652_c0_g1_i1.p1 TRINITY_DN5652_c0_g1~~TRINITY_DN5652_c0_g1_i1.p1  ORF type:complete len:110 (+),score=0.53 TRINITY_DN5652_c0_g1_i1:135-464(+)
MHALFGYLHDAIHTRQRQFVHGALAFLNAVFQKLIPKNKTMNPVSRPMNGPPLKVGQEAVMRHHCSPALAPHHRQSKYLANHYEVTTVRTRDQFELLLGDMVQQVISTR